MKKCKNGHEVASSWKFCIECGEPVKWYARLLGRKIMWRITCLKMRVRGRKDINRTLFAAIINRRG